MEQLIEREGGIYCKFRLYTKFYIYFDTVKMLENGLALKKVGPYSSYSAFVKPYLAMLSFFFANDCIPFQVSKIGSLAFSNN